MKHIICKMLDHKWLLISIYVHVDKNKKPVLTETVYVCSRCNKQHKIEFAHSVDSK